MIASCLAGLAGILAAPIVSLTPTTMTLAIVPALAAALVAELSSFTVAAAAALLIGVGQSLCVKAAASWGWFPQRGMTEVLPFIVIAVMILVRGKRLPDAGRFERGAATALAARRSPDAADRRRECRSASCCWR